MSALVRVVPRDVRFTPQKRTCAVQLRDVRFGPIADIGTITAVQAATRPRGGGAVHSINSDRDPRMTRPASGYQPRTFLPFELASPKTPVLTNAPGPCPLVFEEPSGAGCMPGGV
jgi:hypothetical protein